MFRHCGGITYEDSTGTGRKQTRAFLSTIELLTLPDRSGLSIFQMLLRDLLSETFSTTDRTIKTKTPLCPPPIMKTPLPDNPELDRLSQLILKTASEASEILPVSPPNCGNLPNERGTNDCATPNNSETNSKTSLGEETPDGVQSTLRKPALGGLTSPNPDFPSTTGGGPLSTLSETLTELPIEEGQQGLLPPPEGPLDPQSPQSSTPKISKLQRKPRLGGGILRRMRRGLQKGRVNVAVVNQRLLARHGNDREKAKEEVLNMIDFMQRASVAAKAGGAT